ncbi:hypothetical protein BX666DRAFT_2000205 [Dichotomocladium elegans]|nr:hypothetical protein BX666DRAFT_2000205 [Dichotomocladium elegans]
MDKSDSSRTTASSTLGTSNTEDEALPQQPPKNSDRRPPSTLLPPAARPKLTTIHSSDQSRFMTLERLQQNMTLKPPPKLVQAGTGQAVATGTNPGNTAPSPSNAIPIAAAATVPTAVAAASLSSGPTPQQAERQLTIETAVFEQQPIFQHEKKQRSQQTSDTMRSGSESAAPSRPRPQRKAKRRNKPFTKPTEIFAQNLSDAVLHANIDSDEDESYVYRDYRPSSLYPTMWNDHYTSKNYPDIKPRRPVLRSAVSELPTIALLRSGYPLPPPRSRKHDWYPSDADDTPLLPRHAGSMGKRKRRAAPSKSLIVLWVLVGVIITFAFMWLVSIFMARPLEAVEVMEISNVLGSTKELFFDLHVRARNSNWWSVRISHASFSVFASSQYVPTSLSNISQIQAAPVEFLGTIYELDEPLVFAPGNLFGPTASVANTQIQIKNPGKTKGDSSGNERWSLLIRYPYELTVRGVLKYKVMPISPFMQIHSARVCHVSRIDPATGEITKIPETEKSVCDDPSPVENVHRP